MTKELIKKVLRLATQICWMNGSRAGDRTCQDWDNDTSILNSLTTEERNFLLKQYEEYNSNGEDYIDDYPLEDEMLISFVIARALEVLLKEEVPSKYMGELFAKTNAWADACITAYQEMLEKRLMNRIVTNAGIVQVNPNGQHFWIEKFDGEARLLPNGMLEDDSNCGLFELADKELALFKELLELRVYIGMLKSEDHHDAMEN